MYRMGKEEIEAVAKVIESGKIFKTDSVLKTVYHAEELIREKMGAKFAIDMTSGYAALVAGLIALGVGPGDEVIVPAYTYIATAMAVVKVGAIPVLAEVNASCTIDPADVEAKITKHTKAIIPVHIQGFPCDMDAIMKIAKKHGLFVVEDACQADGGSFGGKRLGTIGDAGAYSFNYYKIISTGEGGALVTGDKGIYERALIYHDSNAICFFGDQMNGVEEEPFCGDEYRANEILGAILCEQLKKMDTILADLRRNKKQLMDLLAKAGYGFIPSNDSKGDCGTTVALRFPSEEEARAFIAKVDPVFHCKTPVDTGKHVYRNWPFITNKKGAYHPAFDPFKMEANKGLAHEHYSVDQCPATIENLSRTVYLDVKADWTEADVAEKAKAIINAAK